MSVGSLRHGLKVPGEYGETVEWRHWYVCIKNDLTPPVYREKRGCITHEILTQLASFPVSSIPGFLSLK